MDLEGRFAPVLVRLFVTDLPWSMPEQSIPITEVKAKVLLINLGADAIEICRGQQIAQLVIAPVQRSVLKQVSTLDETDRIQEVLVQPDSVDHSIPF